MGNEQSTPKGEHRKEKPSPPQFQPTSTPPPAKQAHPPPQPAQEPPAPAAPAQPIDVPAKAEDAPISRVDDMASSIEPSRASQQDYLVSSPHFSRPPRLPLPIEEEDHRPGSPILPPQDFSSPLDHDEVEGTLPRHNQSMLSDKTADDEDLGDEFKSNTGRPTVPTIIEWEGPGERVYVTGTFAGWDRKYRLHRK